MAAASPRRRRSRRALLIRRSLRHRRSSRRPVATRLAASPRRLWIRARVRRIPAARRAGRMGPGARRARRRHRSPRRAQPPQVTRSMALELRPYQAEAISAIEDAERRGVRRPLLGLPTGTGKTVIFAALIRRRGGSALVLAHRDELLVQATDKIRQVDPDAQLGLVKAEANDVEAPVVVASMQTLARESRLARLPQRFKTVVVDEAHHATADSYRRVL